MELIRYLAPLALVVTLTTAVQLDRTPLLMPGVLPEKNDAYFCTSMRLNPDLEQNIVGFLPNVSHTVHHMLLFGCSEPGSQEAVWNCGGEMNMDDGGDPASTSPVCLGDEKILYAWAHNAPNLQLPEGVGFKVGGASRVQYLVMQIHYNDQVKSMHGKKDFSGMTLVHTADELPRQAGVILMAGNGRLPPNRTETVDIACPVVDYVEMHPFAYRTHTHKLGKVVSAYAIQDGEWKLLGKRDPMTPQMFYPVNDDSMVLTTGDVLAARCTYQNTNNHPVEMGSTMKDEMCNLYLMYWTEQPFSPVEKDQCVSLGPPLIYWESFGLRNIPEDASKL